MERYTQDFFAYFGGKQIYKATGAYYTKEEGRLEAKGIYAKLSKTNTYGYLVVCIVSKYPTECYDGKSFGAQPPPPEPKAPAVPKQFVPQRTVVAPKPTTVGPIKAIVPNFPRPRQFRVAGVRWEGALKRGGRPIAPKCPPGYYFSSRFHTCVPNGQIGEDITFDVTKPEEINEAKADLALWGAAFPALHPAVASYSGVPTSPIWTQSDAKMLIAFSDWWNADPNHLHKLATTGVLDQWHLFSLRTFEAGGAGKPASPYNTPGGFQQTSPGQPQPCPPGQVLDSSGKCVSVPVPPPGGGTAPPGGGTAPPPVFSPKPGEATPPPLPPPPPPVTPPSDATKKTESTTPWGWIIGGVALAGIAGLAIWSGARGVGGATGEAGAKDNPAARKYLVRFVHNISPKDTDVMGPVDIPDGAFSNRSTLAKALRDARVLPSGGRIKHFRVEGDKVVVFPMRSIWWSIILSPWSPAGGVREVLGLDSVDRVHSNPVPFKNVYWRDIKSEDRVTLEGKPRSQYYVVTRGRTKAVAYWEGREARQAQRFLKARAAIDQGGTLNIRDLSQKQLDNPKGSRRVGTIGDVNPVDYGGGVIYRSEYGTRVEYTHGLDGGDTPERMVVYSVDVPEDVFAENNWVKIDQIASTIGADPEELLAAGRSRKLMDRVYALEAIASTWGWHELDNYPLTMTEQELRRRWRSY